MSHYSVGAGQNMGGNMQLSYYGGINQGNYLIKNQFFLASVKKKVVNGGQKAGGVNGMLAALQPTGTIHLGGVSNLNASVMNNDFKMTMKHNSSNNSI